MKTPSKTRWLKIDLCQKLRFFPVAIFMSSGPMTKTDLSLVDKIELARTYQPLTGREIKILCNY